MKRNALTVIAVIIAAALCSFFPSAAGDEASPLVTLRGDWMAMGMSYGRQTAPLIRENYDALFEKWSSKPFGSEYLRACLGRFRLHIEAFFPQEARFIDGIAMGAGSVLAESPFYAELPDREKILFLTCSRELFTYDGWHGSASGRAWGAPPRADDPSRGLLWTLDASRTFSQDTLAGFSRDLSWCPSLKEVTLRVVPAEACSRRFITTVPAGWAGSDFIMNEHEFICGYLPLGGSIPAGKRKEMDCGVPPAVANLYCALFCDGPSESAKVISEGTALYRKKTGRRTLLHAGRGSYLLVDPRESVLVERTARHYYYGAPVSTRGFSAARSSFSFPDSFNEEGMRTLLPMGTYGSSSGAAGADKAGHALRLLSQTLLAYPQGPSVAEARRDFAAAIGESRVFSASYVVLKALSFEQLSSSPPGGTWRKFTFSQ
ncbi:MAG: hypothetical protein RDV48_14640 [Candidatus Eremiobacteraeota bacterium]|nr:hypothetical protein [Candidatus Eremiobacteraeota bacterium]